MIEQDDESPIESRSKRLAELRSVVVSMGESYRLALAELDVKVIEVGRHFAKPDIDPKLVSVF